jgi:hypothetical protein
VANGRLVAALVVDQAPYVVVVVIIRHVVVVVVGIEPNAND